MSAQNLFEEKVGVDSVMAECEAVIGAPQQHSEHVMLRISRGPDADG
jgi:hypothetical protein